MATILTDAGKAITTGRLKGLGLEPLYIGWGTGGGTAAHGDTTLFSEAAEARVTGVSSQQLTTYANDTYQVTGTITCAGAGKTITNAGNFDALASGNLYVKGDFTGVALNVGDSIAFTIKCQYT